MDTLEKVEDKANVAYRIYNDIKEARSEAGKQFLRLGSLFKTIRDQHLYTYLDCSSFEEFLGMPELGFARATVFLFIRVFDTCIGRLGLEADRVSRIDISKLQFILPVIDKFPDEAEGWVVKAEVLGREDLRREVAERQGKAYKELRYAKEQAEQDFTADYVLYVRSSGCCACGAKGDADPHHFPRTKGAGAGEMEVIPLCRKCHTESHTDPHKFLIENEHRIFGYFYDTIKRAVKVLSGESIHREA